MTFIIEKKALMWRISTIILYAETKLVMVATYNFNGENKFHTQHEYNKVEGSIILSGVTFDKVLMQIMVITVRLKKPKKTTPTLLEWRGQNILLQVVYLGLGNILITFSEVADITNSQLITIILLQ